jgi:hypothetical protein
MMGDFNVRVDDVEIEQNLGMHGEETCNRNSLKVIDYILCNQLKIMNVIIEHKDSHKYTYVVRNQRSGIDYKICNKKLADMVVDTRDYRGPEIETDHYLLVCSICMRQRWYKKKQELINIDFFQGKFIQRPQHNLVI